MDFDEEEDLVLDAGKSRGTPRAPPASRDRRRRTSLSENEPFSFIDGGQVFESMIKSTKGPMGGHLKHGMWLEEANEEPFEPTVSQGQRQRQVEMDTDITVEPIIPDIEEMTQGEFIHQTAEAPNMSTFINHEDLRTDILKHAAFATLNGIELSILAHKLAADTDVKEEDCQWTWDSLISEIGSKFLEHAEEK